MGAATARCGSGAAMSDARLVPAGALRIALIYAGFGGLWILLSDQVLGFMTQDPAIMTALSIAKGWLFIFVTTVLLYVLIRRFASHLQAAHQRELDAYAEKERTFGLLSAIADASDDAIFAKDLQGRYLVFNTAASRFVGKPAESVLGCDDRALFPADQAEMLMAVGRRVIATGQTETNEEVLDTAHGRRIFLATKGPLRDADQRSFGTFGVSRDITERKRIEASLREQEERLLLLNAHVPAAIAMFDRDMRYLAVSRRWLDDYGLVGRDLIGLCHYDVFPEIGDDLKAIHQRGLAGEVVASQDSRFVRFDGRSQWLRWEMRPWMRSGNAVGGIVLFSEDITERKLAELALRESEVRFHDIVAASADWIWEVDVQARYTYASDSVVGLLGYTPAEIIGKTPFDFMPPDEAVRLRAEFAAIVAARRPFRDLENINVHKDGSHRHVWTNGMPILDADGKLVGYRGLDRDITERKSAEQQLRLGEERYRLLVNNLKVVIFQTDARQTWTFLNPAWFEITGFTVAASIGSSMLDYVHPEDRPIYLDLFARVMGRETDYCRHTMRFRQHQGGFRWIEIYARLVLDDAGAPKGTAGTLTDITERKAADEELQRRNDELERFNRATVGRELDVIEMKKAINALSLELGRTPPYPLAFLHDLGDEAGP